jgi:putative metallopeptidase DUF6775
MLCMTKIKGIFIYSDYPSKALSIERIIDYLRDYGLFAQYRGNIFEFLDLTAEEAIELSRRVAEGRVSDISAPIDGIREPIYEEIDVELSSLRNGRSSLGVLYDGLWLQRIFHKIMSEKIPEFTSGSIHVIFTSGLFGTFEASDYSKSLPFDNYHVSEEKEDTDVSAMKSRRPTLTYSSDMYPGSQRYHARVILMGLPSLISTSGIVEAPARPKDYYWLKAGFIRTGKDISDLDLIYKGKFIEYDDSRITEALSPYLLQSVFYELTGSPFCDNPACCLYNSHWQEEVLMTQVRGKLCGEHAELIRQKKSPSKLFSQ